MPTLVRAAVLTNYLEVAQHLGLNPQTELAKVGLNRKMLQDPEQPIPISSAVQLLENSAASSGCQTLGLRMAESRQFSDLGAVSLLLTHQPTLRDALHVLVQYRHLLNRSLALYVEEAGDLVIIREEVVNDEPVPCRQSNELAIGVMARLCATLLGQHWRPVSVNFTHDAPEDLRLHRRLFACQVQFGAEFNGIACPAANFDAPNPNADPAMARYAQRFVDTLQDQGEPSISHEVRKAIYLLLPMGRATIEQISQALGMNVRTLQRRLGECDANFSDLINEVRRELVQRYMNNPSYSLARIGDLLGYSLPSSFTRWFASQFGVTPAAWRGQHGKPYQQPV
ncbi:AraC family transcriptional regulator [Rugamonas apoptosis]|uniref:AraC family transcriptional regulator n=1 Tax=Rugamonas apoptosis TaxID=2758570 RepID=A0A7W2FCP1_9BURK|nr:AraC family transcriptional regulator [Rugamonas apoptosis]MBA5689240.1 AraC family transcriptional regulator [Rugamonas apoptosis]